MSLDAQPEPAGPASARVYRDPEVEIQLQILRRLDRIIELLSGPKVELRPGGGNLTVSPVDAHMWQSCADQFKPTEATR
jgi:hypothetical protein